MNNTLEKREKVDFTKNAVKYIKLYKRGNTWGFDEPVLGLVFEAFVMGASEAIQDMIDNHPTLTNKETPSIEFGVDLPKFDAEIFLLQDLGTNAWYTYEKANGETQELWLCSVLSAYMHPSPKRICINFKD